MRIERKARRRNRGMVRLLGVIALLLALLIWVDFTMRPGIESIVAYQTKVYATRLVHEAMIAQMEREDVNYTNFLHIARGSDGEVRSIEADMVRINQFKSAMSDAVIAKLSHSGSGGRSVSIPLGTLIGNQFTAGHGPLVSIRVTPAGYVQTEIYDKFTAAGINQTLHQIMLRVGVEMIAVLPGYSVDTETVTSFCIAETVIVGKIPQGYASIGELTTFSPVDEASASQ